jgi:hypothetical protein
MVLEYVPNASPMKPYVRQLFTPGGVQILRDLVPDHKHHHGLMFAVAVDGVNFWEEAAGCGRQVPHKGEAVQTSFRPNNLSRVGFSQRLDWLGPDNMTRLEERRTIEVQADPRIPATLLSWQCRLVSPGRTAKLTGSHYYGLGMRFVESMDSSGRFLYSGGTEGLIVRGSERVTPGKWCAYTSQVDGKPVTAAMFDDPRNSHSAYFFTMRPFAYLAATTNLWKEPRELKADSPLDLRYGIALWDGVKEAKEIEQAYQIWLKRGP